MNVSVCIPTYNQGIFIEQAIRSVAGQSIPPFEIIVSNDHSTDNTQQVLDKLQKEFRMLKVIHQPVNLGISANVNACLKMAAGQLVVRLDSDDVLAPAYIEKLTALLLQFPEAGYAHGAVQEIDKNNQPLNKRYLFRTSIYQTGDEALKAALKGYRVAANIVMFRKAALEAAGYIRSKVNFAEDFFLSVDIAAAGWGNVYCSDIISCYRVWNDSGQVRQRRKLAEINGFNHVFTDAMQPAFEKRNWNLQPIEKAKEAVATVHAECLCWNFFSITEKQELEQALLHLSASAKTKRVIWMYKHNWSRWIKLNQQVAGQAKRGLKKLLHLLKPH